MKKLGSIKSKLILMLITVIAFCFAATCGYYAFVLNLIRDKEEVYVRNSVNQVVQNIQTSTEDMIRFAKIASTSNATQDFLTSSNPLTRLENSRDVSNSIFSITQDSSEIAILIMEEDGVALAPKPLLTVIDALESDYLPALSGKSTGFTGLMHNSYDGVSYFAYYRPILDIKKDVQLQRQIGACVVLKSLNTLQKCINLVETTPHSLFYVLDDDLEVIVSNQSQTDSAAADLLHNLRTGTLANGAVRSVNGSDHMILFQSVPNTDWLVVGAVPLNEINSDLTGLLFLGITVLLLLGLLFGFWGIAIFRSVALPVFEISRFLKGDAYSKLHKRLYLKNENEVGVLAEQINRMLDELSEMTHTILRNNSNMYELDLARKRAELSALQSQINPHFLYNTLDCINSLVELNRPGDIKRTVTALADIMRMSIKGREILTVRENIRYVEQYMFIERLRYTDKLIFLNEIPDSMMDYYIPKLILQPILENSVIHGISEILGRGMIGLSGREEPDALVFSVKDNGRGFPAAVIERIHRCAGDSSLTGTLMQESLGLLNIQKRIQLMYGAPYGLEIENLPGGGSCVTVRLPKRTAPELPAPDAEERSTGHEAADRG